MLQLPEFFFGNTKHGTMVREHASGLYVYSCKGITGIDQGEDWCHICPYSLSTSELQKQWLMTTLRHQNLVGLHTKWPKQARISRTIHCSFFFFFSSLHTTLANVFNFLPSSTCAWRFHLLRQCQSNCPGPFYPYVPDGWNDVELGILIRTQSRQV